MVHFNVSSTMRTAVIGIGGLGHLAVQYLAAFGCEVAAVSSTHDKDDQARKFGASRFIASKDDGELAKAKKSFDFILSTVSGDVNWKAIIDMLRPEGRLVICGVPDSDIGVSAFSVIPFERSVTGARTGSPSDIADMLAFTARHEIKPMIEPFAMSEVNAAVDRVRSGKARFRAVLVA
jgi:uncharacterized zinc-type alcohol dehydrogenase-like protein